MRAALLILAGLGCSLMASAADSAVHVSPAYTPSSLVNSASDGPGPIAPNTIVSLKGENLAYVTRALTSSDIKNNSIPTVLPSTGVRVLIGNNPAPIYFVSPRQINLLLPPDLIPGRTDLRVTVDGLAGPLIPIVVSAAAPALYLQAENTALAAAPDGRLFTAEKPAHSGDVVVLYATGLGEVFPKTRSGEIPTTAAPLATFDGFSITLGGQTVPRDNIQYAGVCPGLPGLYQINLIVPLGVGSNPTIVITASGIDSPAGIVIPIAQ